MQPKVMEAKRQGEDISWCSAIAKAFRSESSVSKSSKQTRGKKSNFGGHKGKGRGGSTKIAMSAALSLNQGEMREPSPNQEKVDKTSDKSCRKISADNSEQETGMDNSSMPIEKSNKLWLMAIETNE